MAIYYLVSERLVPAYLSEEGMLSIRGGASFADRRSYYDDSKLRLPANYRVARLDAKTSIHVVFFDVDYGHFLIKAPNQATAYAALRALDAFFFLATGDAPDLGRSLPRLLELDHVPQAEWTNDDLHRELRKRNWLPDPAHLVELYSGRGVLQSEMRLLAPCVEAVYGHRSLAEALNHLGHSRFLFNGFMVGSYYQCHYKHDRADVNPHDMQKRYLENRERYELAFVSAFKGIERFLDVNQIKRDNIERALIRLNQPSIEPTTPYKRWHEIFSGHREKVPYQDLIVHFLDIRNGVAAHANPEPPQAFVISEDNLMEIQLFLGELCSKALASIQPRPLPARAILNVSGS